MKRVLFVIDTLRMGGAEKSLVSLLKALDPERVRADLFLFEGSGVLRGEVPDWVNVIEADPVTRAMTLEIRYYLKDLLRSGHFRAAADRVWMSVRSVLHRHCGFSQAFEWKYVKNHIPQLDKHYDAAVGCLEGMTDFFVLDKVQADRKVGWIHTDMSVRSNPPQDAEYYARFDAMATISDACMDAFAGCFPEAGKKICVIENIVLPEDVLKKANAAVPECWERDRVHLITVGRLYHQKGIDVAARACRILKERGLSLCWHVYGDGVMKEEISAYVEENELTGWFILEGLTSNPYPYMKKADLLVQPSRVEGKSIVLDEAKILGKAIVATNYPSVGDQITDRVNGLITGMEPEQIADGIELLLKDPELKARLEQNAAAEQNSSYRALEKFYQMIEA